MVELASHESPSSQSPVIPDKPTEPSKSDNKLLKKVMLIAILIVVGAGIYYGLSLQSVSAVYIEMKKFNSSTNAYLGTFTADVTMLIGNKGLLEVTLSDLQSTLYLNEVNVNNIGFQDNWYKFPGGYSNTFSGSYVSRNTSDSQKLANTNSYNVVLKLKAKAQCGLITEFIEVEYRGTWGH